MPTNRSYIRRPHRARITPDQEMDLWLGSGPQYNLRPFANEEARRSAWFRHRERLLAWLAKGGRRPEAWWRYEASITYPGYDYERSALYEAGLLGDDERVALEREWRSEFERSWEPEFFFCNGPGDIWEGARARRAHYRWADIPRGLLKRWEAARKRSARTIEKLKDDAFSASP